MEKYGRGWQRLPSWVGDDRQLIQPGGRPAKGGQMLGFSFIHWRTWPHRLRTSSRRKRARSRRSAGLGEVGWSVARRWAEARNVTGAAEAR